MMKLYIAPEIKVIDIDTCEVVANSGNTIVIDPTPTDRFAPELRRGSGWEDYEQ